MEKKIRIKAGPVTAFYEKTGVDAFTTTPEELAAFQLAETKKWGDIIKKANIQPE